MEAIDFLSVNECIRRSGGTIGRTSIYAYLKSGKLKSVRRGGRRVIDYASFLALNREASNDA